MELSKLLPPVYHWLVQNGLFGDAPSTRMCPWYFIKPEDLFDFNAGGSNVRLIAFARRQDNDDFAAYKTDGESGTFVLVHHWTANGFDEVAAFSSIWDWLKAVVDDLEEVYGASGEG